jgi:hypothetical protein
MRVKVALICFYLVSLTVISSLSGCAARTNLRPVGRGNVTVNASVGGPIVAAFGTHMPIPYGTVGANYGIADNCNLTGSLHLLPLAYEIIGMDFGAGIFPVLNDGMIPTVGVHQSIMLFGSIKPNVDDRFRAYPITSATFAWQFSNGLVYSGVDLTSILSSADYDDEAPSFILSPFAGHRWQLSRLTGLLLELKWHGANIRSDQLAVEYTSVGRHGALAPFISIEKRF